MAGRRDDATAITLRPATVQDAAFAYRVLEQTMRGYAIATWGVWPEAQERIAQHELAACGALQIIECEGEAIGVLRVERHADHLDLDQLYLLPGHQRQGIGEQVVKGLLAQAGQQRLEIRLRVLRVNPAQRFYARLGFVIVQQTPERLFMQWPPRD
jgi:GNAT superfamily N-acetyltransferase